MRAWLANKFAIPIYIVRFLRRNKTARSVVSTVVILTGLGLVISPEVTLTILSLVLRTISAIGFLMVQFIGLFWFLSRSKSVTILPGDKTGLSLLDYKGQPALVGLMQEWLKILGGSQAFKDMGGMPPSGMILHGSPGTGKTYLLKCLASSAGVAFHSLDGASFSAMFIGVPVLKTLAYVNKCRSLAMEHTACVGYIDEIDALGSARGGQQGGMAIGGMMGGSGGMGALTTLLSEIDGMGTERNMTVARNIARSWFGLPAIHEGFVFWTGGTNRPEVLDKALTRPGRMEHLIAVDPPDGPGRREIFSYYLDKVQHDPVDVDILVSQTQGITPAAIQSAIMRSSPRIALTENRDRITRLDISRALIEQTMGIANPIGDLPKDQRWQICVHEASHACASWILRKDHHIAFVSAVRRGAALGFMLPVQKESTYAVPLASMIADIRVSLAGDIGTKIILGQRWTGAASDLEHVRQRVLYLAWHGVFGSIMLGNDLPKSMLEAIDRFMKEQWDATEELLRGNESRIRALAERLMEKEELTGEEATNILEAL